MLNKILQIFLFSMVFVVVRADTIEINPDNPGQYVVQKGDTLWDIAGRFLQEPWRWPEIWKSNSQIADPHLIYPGDLITLSYEGDTPVLTVESGASSETVMTQAVVNRNVKLSPRIREYERDSAIPIIPIDVIRHFLNRPLVVNDGDLEKLPYIVSTFEQHLIAAPGNRVYVRGLPAGSNARSYSLYRKGSAYVSTRKYGGAVLGYEAIYVGDIVIQKDGDPASAMIVKATREVLNGDRLIEHSDSDIRSDFMPHQPRTHVSGNIISVVDGVAEIGQYQIVVLDIGEKDGVEIGNVVGIYQTGQIITDKNNIEQQNAFNSTALVEYLGRPKSAGEDVILPEEYAGVVMVFRTFEKISYGLVMEASRPVHINDAVRNL